MLPVKFDTPGVRSIEGDRCPVKLGLYVEPAARFATLYAGQLAGKVEGNTMVQTHRWWQSLLVVPPTLTRCFILAACSLPILVGCGGVEAPNLPGAEQTQKWDLNMFGDAYVTVPPFTNSGAFSETSDSPGWHLSDMVGQNRVRVPVSGMISHTASGDVWSFTITVANNGLTWTAHGTGTADGSFPNAMSVAGTVTGVLCQPPSAGGGCSNETHHFMGTRM